MITVKLSYSILHAWEQGRYEEAVGMYLGKDLPATPEMELGRLKHQLWERYIRKNNALPPELGGNPLVNPQPEVKKQLIIPFSDKIQILLRGIPDCPDDTGICYEFKCGMREAVSYVDEMQLPFYKLLVPTIHTGIYKCYNPYTGRHTTGVVFLDEAARDRALEYIITYGGELIDYLQAQRLIINYKKF